MVAAVDLRGIRQALRNRLLTVTGIVPEERIAPQNRPFTPPEPPAPWIRETLLIAGEGRVSTGAVESRGRVQYDVITPQGMGTEFAEDLSTAIADSFEAANGLSDEGVELVIDRVERGSGRQFDPAWWFVPVNVAWRSFAFVP